MRRPVGRRTLSALALIACAGLCAAAAPASCPKKLVTTGIASCSALADLLSCISAGSKVKGTITLACGRIDCTGVTLTLAAAKVVAAVSGGTGCRTRMEVSANESVTTGLFDVSSGAVLRLMAVDLRLRGKRPALTTNAGGGVFFTRVSVFNGKAAGNGGAVQLVNTPGRFLNCRFEGNTAGGSGGAIYALVGTTTASIDAPDVLVQGTSFVVNQAATKGGAIFLDGAIAVVDGSSCYANLAQEGGALYANGNGAATPTTTSLKLQGTSFTDHTVTGPGGAVSLLDTSAIVESCSFLGNTASMGGGLAAQLSQSANLSLSIAASHVYGNSASDSGGGLHVAGLNLGLSVSEILSNTLTTAGDLGGATGSGVHWARGKLLATSGASITIVNSDIASNTIATAVVIVGGGGAATTPNTVVGVRDSSFRANQSPSTAALVLDNTLASVTGCVFAGNAGGQPGGTLFASVKSTSASTQLAVESCTFESNTVTPPPGVTAPNGAVMVLLANAAIPKPNFAASFRGTSFRNNTGAAAPGSAVTLFSQNNGQSVSIDLADASFEGNTPGKAAVCASTYTTGNTAQAFPPADNNIDVCDAADAAKCQLLCYSEAAA